MGRKVAGDFPTPFTKAFFLKPLSPSSLQKALGFQNKKEFIVKLGARSSPTPSTLLYCVGNGEGPGSPLKSSLAPTSLDPQG